MRPDGIRFHSDLNGTLKSSRRSDLMSTNEHETSVERQEDRFVETPTESTSSPQIDRETVGEFASAVNSINESILELLHAGVKEYLEGERALLFMLYPETPIDTNQLACRKITHSELIKFEKGCLPLVHSLLTKWCPIFRNLPVKIQATIFRSFHAIWSPLQKCFLTATWIPAAPIGGFVFHYGLYVDVFDQFFNSDNFPQESRKYTEKMRFLGMMTAEKMRKLEIREIEFGALAGIILANEIDSTFKCAVMSIFRERIFQDLHANITSVYGEQEVGTRMAALICLIQDLDVLGREIVESVIIRRLINNGINDLWDD
ncbi:hypothetical protein M3Y94_01064300 [Aphelenchoides besseyi]|nr:hypothetical protein M3Y94_01064300 [Aphelenchoides besseyi]